ncbi:MULTISPECIES: hypothetical protein [Aerosakkonema]|uniref:hypothetical protein n=1 Tax=Aerosakkonema TaxID=1246629 RepID=UPI0035B849B1
MFTTTDLTEIQWQIAHGIAQTLVKEETDVNELGKVMAYLRAYSDRENAGTKFFSYLQTLSRQGNRIGYSQKTSGYYDSIERTCTKYLQLYQNDVTAILQILGWSIRLMRYYKEAGPIGEITAPVIESTRQAEILQVTQSQDFAIDQILDAQVIGIAGNKVTYQILGAIKLTEKEPKKASSLQQGQIVKVKITALKNGSIKSVKCVD